MLIKEPKLTVLGALILGMSAIIGILIILGIFLLILYLGSILIQGLCI